MCPASSSSSVDVVRHSSSLLLLVGVDRSRPQFIHKYSLNSQSIYSAVSVGLTGEHILNKLRIFSKLEIPPSVTTFVTKTAEACGTVQMALVEGKYYVESESQVSDSDST